MAGGLCCGLSALGAGLTIGIVGDVGVRANAAKDIYVGMILILIFAEALGLYGLIVAIILSDVQASEDVLQPPNYQQAERLTVPKYTPCTPS